MANKAWVGTTDADFDTVTNWSPSGIPANDDHLIFNDASNRELTGNIDATTLTGKAFSVDVAPGFTYFIGTSDLPFEPAEGFTTIVYAGQGTTPSYFSAASGKTITRGIVNTTSIRDEVCVFQGDGSIDQVIIRQGKAKLDSTTVTDGGRIEVLGSAGSASAELSIPSGNALAGVDVGIHGGRISCASDVVTVRCTGGEFILAGGADLTTLELHNGIFFWDATDVSSASTITESEIFGGTFKVRKDRAGRTLTNMNVYTGGTADFSIGGLSITFTNPVRNLGGTFLQPMGSSWTMGA